MASLAWKWDLKGGGSGREKVENKTRRGTRSFGGRPFLGGRWWRRWKPMGHPKRVPRRKTKSPVMTGKRSTQLVGTGRGRVERRSPSAKANLTSHFHSTCSWQPASPRLQRRQRRKRTLGRKGRGKKRVRGTEANRRWEGSRSTTAVNFSHLRQRFSRD